MSITLDGSTLTLPLPTVTDTVELPSMLAATSTEPLPLPQWAEPLPLPSRREPLPTTSQLLVVPLPKMPTGPPDPAPADRDLDGGSADSAVPVAPTTFRLLLGLVLQTPAAFIDNVDGGATPSTVNVNILDGGAP